jgi:RNA polymerase sigma factor (sigma-70 family)
LAATDGPMKTIQLSAVGRLKHTDLWRAAVKVGGQTALAKYLGVEPSRLNSWVNLKSLPPVTSEDLARSPSWTAERHVEFERKLLALTGKTLPELFPEGMRQCTEFLKASKEFEQTQEFTTDELLGYAEMERERRAIAGPVHEAEQGEVKELITHVLKTIPERERRILSQLYGLNGEQPRSYYELAEVEGCTHQNIRHIEQRAMSKLRMPARISLLLSYAE